MIGRYNFIPTPLKTTYSRGRYNFIPTDDASVQGLILTLTVSVTRGCAIVPLTKSEEKTCYRGIALGNFFGIQKGGGRTLTAGELKFYDLDISVRHNGAKGKATARHVYGYSQCPSLMTPPVLHLGPFCFTEPRRPQELTAGSHNRTRVIHHYRWCSSLLIVTYTSVEC